MKFEFSQREKWLVLAVIAGIIILVVIWQFKTPLPAVFSPSGTNQQQTSTPSGTSGQQESVTQQPSGGDGTYTQPKSIANALISMVTPSKGEVWLIGNIHTIRWTHGLNNSGGLQLLNVPSKTVAGLITPSLTSGQTAYQWDTIYIFTNKTGAQKQLVLPGTYAVKVVFNGPYSPVESAPFYLIATGTEVMSTNNISIGNGLFSPNLVTVNHSERVVITNNDSNQTHTLQLNGVTLIRLTPNSSYVFDASQVASGSYEFRLADSILTKLTVTVQ